LWTWWSCCARGGNRRRAALVSAREGHCALEVAGRLEFHIDADRVREAAGEEVHLLRRGERAGVGHLRQECFLVRRDGAAEGKPCEVGQMVDSEGGAEPLLAEELELGPGNGADVTLQHEVPMLCGTGHVEGVQPHLVALAGALRSEEVLAVVDPAERVVLAIKCGERELVEARDMEAIPLVVVGGRQH